MRWVSSFVVVMLLVAAVPGAAAIQQMTAAKPPTVEGPLTPQEPRCDRKRQIYKGEVAGVAKRCLHFYAYSPASESDFGNDYGVLWLQSTVDGKNGWCASRVNPKILLPEGLGLHARAPTEGKKVAGRSAMTTDLALDANGNGEPARVKQDWIAYPESFSTTTAEDNTLFKLSWTGKTGKPLGFAHGIEVSWPTDAPPEGISVRLDFRLAAC
ncbi:MAG TPA: hypothetical protein VNP73_05315 [Actinomycetota bacterium]|nr:hypothetical protein [Actinomycetota bacterium]